MEPLSICPPHPELSDPGYQSETSTVLYDEHEPYISLMPKVELLARSIWPDSDESHVIELERMRGGGYNRIVGLKRVCRGPEGKSSISQYILRIPRWDNPRLGDDIAVLRFLQHREPKLRAPHVVAFDTTANNPLGAQYMIQKRVPGYTLEKVLPIFDHSDKCRLAAELGSVYHDLLATKMRHVGRNGRPTAPPGEEPGLGLYIAPFCSTQVADTVPWGETRRSPAPKTSPSAFMVETIQARITDVYKVDPNNSYEAGLWVDFAHIAMELEEMGDIQPGLSSLCHLDLAPRNIVVSFRKDKPMIRGILDWDSAVIAPSCMAANPPLWLWGPEGVPEVDDEKAAEEPGTPEKRELKQIFDNAAGPEYVRLAYDPFQRLARRLIRFVMANLGGNEDLETAEAIIKEWKETWV